MGGTNMNISELSVRERRLKELKEAKIDQNAALIEYIAMMADVTLPIEEEATVNEMVRESPEFL